MRRKIISLAAGIAGLAAAASVAMPALAHHGWAWTEDGFFELEGTIVAISFGNPHPTLDVDTGGETWRVDLATPAATMRAGFTEDKASVGDEVYAIGNRSRESTERWMKAVRIVVNGETFDVYPNRVPSN
jgi:hypothetical protein